jgi:protocatechuate 3,4-dioxygenase beta subunit
MRLVQRVASSRRGRNRTPQKSHAGAQWAVPDPRPKVVSSFPPTPRRRLLCAAAAAALLGGRRFAVAQPLAATPACAPGGAPTEAQTAGPYFKPSSPERSTLLEPGLAGERLVLSGRVLATDCSPVARALLDVWQADADGAYDNRGFRLRGHLFTDADGRYRLETIVPGLYPGRTRHIHVKLQPPGGRVLTTQLYFPDEVLNRRDGLFEPSLLVALERDAGVAQAGFEFVLRRA